MGAEELKRETNSSTISKILELENTRCEKQKYKQIFKNKDQIQVDFINKYLTEHDKLMPDDLMGFVVSLMCEFVGEEKIRYFDLPNVRLENLNLAEAYYDFWHNKIALSSGAYLMLTSEYSSPFDLLDLIDNVGHEMTHFIQFSKLVNRLAKKHDFKIEDEPLFNFEDNILDGKMLQAMRATLDKDTAKKISGLTHEEVAFSANFNRYYLSVHERQARRGGIEFQNKMISKWKECSIEQTKLWKKIQKINEKGVFERKERGMLKSTKKYDRVIASKLTKLVPDLENLNEILNKDDLHKYVVKCAELELKQMSVENLIYSYWQAIKSGNKVMISSLIDVLEEKLTPKQKDEIIRKTIKLLSKGKSYREGRTSVYADVLLKWSDLDPITISFVLYNSVNNMDLMCLDEYLKKMKVCEFSQQVITCLADALAEIYKQNIENFEEYYSKLQKLLEKRNPLNEIEIDEYKDKISFMVELCDKLLPYLSKFDYRKEEYSSYRESCEKFKWVICNAIKKSASAQKNLENDYEIEA